MMVDVLFRELMSVPQIEAVALGGSRAGDCFDEKSDYDIYLYVTAPVEEDVRRRILGPISARVEYGNHFWELEDNGTFKDGIDFDILYRDLDDLVEGVARVVEGHQPSNAYTTCMWHNLITCKVIYDKSGRLTAARERFSVPYPAELRKNIMSQGWRLLTDSMPAYKDQIMKAAGRGDLVSVNHRTAAFMETYFDVLFACNSVTHPGEKRMLRFALTRCPVVPRGLQEDVAAVFAHMFTDPEALEEDLDRMLRALKEII